jgi:hypothetical protein
LFNWGQKLVSFSPARKVCLCLDDDLILRFFLLLQQGFMVKVQVGSNIKSLLCQQFGLSPEYLEKRIQTIFLDGKPVDSVDSAIVKEGSTLALSAAMPGLVGATLRRGGYYALMRSQISYREESAPAPHHEGMIFLKLFNLLLKELGPSFLKRGILIKGKHLSDFLKRQPDDFWAGCKEAKLDDEKIDLETLKEINWADEYVLLQPRTH